MSKKVDGKKFKAAVKALNEVLADDGIDKIKIVGVKKDAVLEAFTTNVQSYIEDEKVADLPDEVIDFYNEFIADDSDADEEEEAVAPKKDKKEKKEKKKKEKKEKAPKAPGIVVLSVKAYMEDGCKTAKEIVEHIQDKFPERNIAKTVSHCFGILKHIKPLK